MKKLLPLCSALLLSLSLSAHSATLKIATLSPDGSLWMKTMKQAAEEVKTATEGRVKFRFYPGGVMGSDDAVLKKMRLGQLHGAAIPGGALSQFAPDTQAYNLPLIFNSYAEVDYVRSKLDGKIQKLYEDAGFVNFGLAEGGFAYLMSKAPIVSPEDLKQRKVWVPSNDSASLAAAKTFEISPIPLPLGDVLASLQTNLIDTVTSSPIGTIALQWHTQVSDITDLPLMYFYGILAISEKAFNKKVSPEDQVIVREIMGKAFKAIDKQNRKDNESAFAALQAQGIKLNKPSDAQKASWKAKTDASIESYLQQGGISQSAYQEVTKLVKQFRQQAQ